MTPAMPIPLHVRKGPLDLVDTILECHERIRHFAGVAVKIGAARGLPDEQILSAAADVQRYFRHGLPHHVDDEKKSILPRLKSRSREVDDALAAMEREHRDHEAPLARVLGLMDAVVAAPGDHARLAAEVSAAAAEISRVFESHLASEEKTVFPALRSFLSPADRSQILAELRARRAAPPPGVRASG
jgi:iron-sulfur cluster repair protein YtfE (RIC family)